MGMTWYSASAPEPGLLPILAEWDFLPHQPTAALPNGPTGFDSGKRELATECVCYITCPVSAYIPNNTVNQPTGCFHNSILEFSYDDQVTFRLPLGMGTAYGENSVANAAGVRNAVWGQQPHFLTVWNNTAAGYQQNYRKFYWGWQMQPGSWQNTNYSGTTTWVHAPIQGDEWPIMGFWGGIKDTTGANVGVIRDVVIPFHVHAKFDRIKVIIPPWFLSSNNPPQSLGYITVDYWSWGTGMFFPIRG
jgi:hypothetical protein